MATAPGPSETPRVAVTRPQRAGSRQKFDALIAAARDVFASDGVNGARGRVRRRGRSPRPGLNLDSPMFGACIALIHRAGEPLLKAAQDAGMARNDVGFEDVRLLINGVASSNFADDAQRERVLGMALDGIKKRS